MTPPGARCADVADNKSGNGGVHFHGADAGTRHAAARAWQAYELSRVQWRLSSQDDLSWGEEHRETLRLWVRQTEADAGARTTA